MWITLFGGLPRMAMSVVETYLKGIIPVTIIEMAGNQNYSVGRAKKLFCEQPKQMLFSFGENSRMHPVSKVSTARYSETKGKSDHRSLSDKLTPLLISAGLVKGITPTSVRKQLGAKIPDIVFWPQAGASVDTPKLINCSFLKD